MKTFFSSKQTLLSNWLKSRTTAGLALVALSAAASADVFSWQFPVQGGGVGRWSKLWVDPSGQGNDLDGDAICYEDFVMRQAGQIKRVEWWGDSAPTDGFQLEVWRQDPGTVAYQPLGVFRNQGAQPEWKQTVTNYSVGIDPSGVWHYTVDLATPISLAANNTGNPRWFFCVIALTQVPYLEWNWAQSRMGSMRTFQWIRGGSMGGGDAYWILGDGRAMVLSGPSAPRSGSKNGAGIGN